MSINQRKENYYTSMKQCATATGVSVKALRIAKGMGGPGFLPSGRIDWVLLEPWLNTNKNLISSQSEESLEFYKIEIAKRDVVLRDLAIQKAKEEMLDPSEVKKFLSQLAVLLSSTIKKKKQELVSKAVGYENIIEKEFDELFSLIKKEVEAFCNK